MATKKQKKSVALKGTFPKKDAARLIKLMNEKGWNDTKAGAHADVSPSVIESARTGASMRVHNIKILQTFLNDQKA